MPFPSCRSIYKGLRGIDWSRAYEIIKKTLTRDHANSSFFSQVEQYGFYPHDLGYEVASIHLENSYNDWCASIMAKKMGKEKDADFFLKLKYDLPKYLRQTMWLLPSSHE